MLLLGYTKCILVAHDWGGMVAWSYAMLHPANVERLIVCNIPHPRAFEKHLNTSFSQLKKSWLVVSYSEVLYCIKRKSPIVELYFSVRHYLVTYLFSCSSTMPVSRNIVGLSPELF